MIRILYGSLLVLVLVLNAAALALLPPPARRTLNLPDTPYRYANVALPAYFTQPGRSDDNTPPENPLSDDGATLGRVLFYDTRLSANNTTACASCHVQAHAFGDPKSFSKGFHGAQTDRRAMPFVNVRYYQRARFFWDERAHGLEQMVLLPIQSQIEMGQDLKQVVETLTRDAEYPKLFARAFGDRKVTEERIGKALAQFIRSIVSYQSKYDQGRARVASAQDDFGNFTRQENRGKALFVRNCSNCHMRDGNEHFFVPIPAKTGLRASDPKADGGVGDVTLRAEDLGSFKPPSLRNVEVTAPYGHDGRFATLDMVIDHYSDTPIVDPNFGYMRVPALTLRFTASEKAALIAFLKTLTDRTSLTDVRFSNPFAEKRDDRSILAAPAMLMAAGAAGARVPAVLRSTSLVTETPTLPPLPSAPTDRQESSHPVIQRLESFDGNENNRLSLQELPERMQGIFARADTNADAALDTNEIRRLVNGAMSRHRSAPCVSHPSEGLPGVIKDLKLEPEKYASAIAIVSAAQLSPDFSQPTDANVRGKMRGVLDDEEFENFVAAAARLPGGPLLRTGLGSCAMVLEKP